MAKKLERWHGAHHYGDKTHLMLVVFLFFAIFTLFWSYFTLAGVHISKDNGPKSDKPIPTQTISTTPSPSAKPSEPIACSQEAKQCPDGKSYTSRTGPNCEFAACPGEHCGGFISNAAVCTGGYHCQLSVNLPDAGGTCVKN